MDYRLYSHQMKVLWIVLGVLGGLCLLCGGCGYFAYSKGKLVFDEAGKFGDDSFTAITRTWDIQALQSRAAPEVEQQNGKDALPNLVRLLSAKLGPMQNFTSSITGINAQNNNGETSTYADWKATATFEKGTGTATMQLIKRGDKWQILKFNVESQALLAPDTSSTTAEDGATPGESSAEPGTATTGSTSPTDDGSASGAQTGT